MQRSKHGWVTGGLFVLSLLGNIPMVRAQGAPVAMFEHNFASARYIFEHMRLTEGVQVVSDSELLYDYTGVKLVIRLDDEKNELRQTYYDARGNLLLETVMYSGYFDLAGKKPFGDATTTVAGTQP